MKLNWPYLTANRLVRVNIYTSLRLVLLSIIRSPCHRFHFSLLQSNVPSRPTSLNHHLRARCRTPRYDSVKFLRFRYRIPPRFPSPSPLLLDWYVEYLYLNPLACSLASLKSGNQALPFLFSCLVCFRSSPDSLTTSRVTLPELVSLSLSLVL